MNYSPIKASKRELRALGISIAGCELFVEITEKEGAERWKRDQDFVTVHTWLARRLGLPNLLSEYDAAKERA